MNNMKDKSEFQYPAGEHSQSVSSNDARLAEARQAVKALSFAQIVRDPERYRSADAEKLLAIGTNLDEKRSRYGLAA